MNIRDDILQRGESLAFSLRTLYHGAGYQPYRMSKFEEYDLYAGNKDFLVSDNVITFTDTNGKLMALKPDVTLSLIRSFRDAPDTVRKVYYNENVYRVSKRADSFREIPQAGLECFGAVTEADVCEVVELAAESLRQVAGGGVLDVSPLGLIERIFEEAGLSASERARLYALLGEKNPDIPDAPEKLKTLLSVCGALPEALPRLRASFPEAEELPALERLAGGAAAPMLRLDLSVVGDTNYYNGLVFKGFVRGVPDAVLSGGQYDNLMRKLRRRSRAVGFAVYLDLLDRAEEPRADDPCLNVALPKGRLGEKVYDMLARAGFECPALLEPNRKLIFENPEKKVRYFWVKPSDVAIYVERGAADVGVAGKDILLEYEPDVYELLDLGTGKCRMAVAAPKTYRDDPSRTLRVATKFSRIAQDFYRSRGRDIDVIHLNGSIEIAPILGLSDVIVDIVETGTTLRENDLAVVEEIVPISARLIANKSSAKFKRGQIEKLTAGLTAIVEEKA